MTLKSDLFKLFSTVTAVLILSACIQSPSPTVSDLIKLAPPTFSGLTFKAYTTSSQVFLMSGECDKNSQLMQYSVNGGDFQLLAPNCLNGTFSKIIDLVHPITTLAVREKGKFSFSDSATAKVTFEPPPSSTIVTAVQGSGNDSSDLVGAGVQATLGLNLTGDSGTGGAVHLETYAPGVIYSK